MAIYEIIDETKQHRWHSASNRCCLLKAQLSLKLAMPLSSRLDDFPCVAKNKGEEDMERN
jgi:hypothetical protein